jgi:hypothetical protein
MQSGSSTWPIMRDARTRLWHTSQNNSNCSNQFSASTTPLLKSVIHPPIPPIREFETVTNVVRSVCSTAWLAYRHDGGCTTALPWTPRRPWLESH